MVIPTPALARSSRFDVIVVGAGFGGLGAALTLAERGARVLLLEALAYPGGCASTFTRHGWRFEAGATLFSGFDEGQLVRGWIDRHRLDVRFERLDPTIRFRMPGVELPVPPVRERLVDHLCALPGAPVGGIRAFFELQRRVADALWELFDDPTLLPPFSVGALLRHALRLPRYLPLVPLVGRPVVEVLREHGVAGFLPLRTYLDALCQITVQAGVEEAESPFALAATDYVFRGTGHVHGGIGVLAQALCGAIQGAGGEVRLASRVSAIEAVVGGWRVRARGEELTAPHVVCNLLPHGIRELVGSTSPRLDALTTRVERGWGAVMLYLGLRPDAALPPAAHHVQLVQDPSLPLVEGNHLFCSVSGAEEAGRGPASLAGPLGAPRTATVSTHVEIARLRALPEDQRAGFIEGIQRRMRAGLRAYAPEVDAAVAHEMTASPRTWQRFTRRAHGLVGGVPRRAGLQNYAGFQPEPVFPGLWMVGDTAFPGQSTLCVALGGYKLAQRLADQEPAWR